MSVGTATAIALAASAASGAYAAHEQASGAKKAAATQAAASDKALALQKEMADRALQAQNQQMYGNQGGGPGGPGTAMGGGLQGIYAPYVNSGGATLSALHQYLGIPGADQNQTAVPAGTYGQPMRGGGQPMGGPMGLYGGGGPQGAQPLPPIPYGNVPQPTGQPFRPKVGPMQQGNNQIPMSALYQRG